MNSLARFLFNKQITLSKHMSSVSGTPEKSTNWKKILIWIAAVLIFIVLLLIIGGFILQNRLPEQLKTQVQSETKGVYQLNFDQMDVSLLTGSIKIKNVQLIPDTGAYFKNQNPASATNLLNLHAASLDVSGVKFLKLIFSKDIQLSTITLNKPDLVVMQMRDTVKVDSSAEKSLYQQMPEFLKDARLKLLRVNDLSYVHQEKGDTTKRGGKWSGLSFALESISIDSLSHQDSTAFWFCRDIRIDSKNVNFASSDGMYKFAIAEVKASIKDRSLNISAFKVIPQYPEIEFTQRMKEPGDRYHFFFQKINAKEIDFKQLEQEGLLHVASLNLEKAELRIFNNKKLQGKKVDKTGNFPHIAIKKLGLPLILDTMFVKNFAIYYKELNPKSDKPGTVFFTNLYGTLYNISNDTLHWKKDSWIRSNFETNFLGKTKLLVNINLNVADKDGEFNYKGSLARGEGKLYNQLLEPLAMARIEEGVINKITFSVNANRFGSTAQVQMLYDNLKVNVLKKDGKVLKKKGLLSFLANTFIVKNSNPRKEGEAPISADISHLHDQDRSFFNLMWKSIFVGLKVNLGLPESK